MVIQRDWVDFHNVKRLIRKANRASRRFYSLAKELLWAYEVHSDGTKPKATKLQRLPSATMTRVSFQTLHVLCYNTISFGNVEDYRTALNLWSAPLSVYHYFTV